MFDRRIIRGSTYASMVVPATTAPNKVKVQEMTKQRPTKAQQQAVLTILSYDR